MCPANFYVYALREYPIGGWTTPKLKSKTNMSNPYFTLHTVGLCVFGCCFIS